MLSLKEVLKELAAIKRQRGLVKESALSEERKTQLLAQLDAAEKVLDAQGEIELPSGAVIAPSEGKKAR